MSYILTFLLALLLCPPSLAACIPHTQAREHIGETQCVSGKVIHVKAGNRGVTFFDYCEDYRVCPFTVVIFPPRLKDIGDVRQLQGRVIEVYGLIKEYDGRAEIVLEHVRQLSGGATVLPPLPKNFDVEKKGRFSAGTLNHPKAKQTSTKRAQTTRPVDSLEDEP